MEYDYKYLIVGGGMTGHSAVQGIRSVDSSGTVGVVTTETDPPYDRPPLSKSLWKGEPLDSIWRRRENQKVTFLFGRTITSIDVARKEAVDSQGNRYSWERLLLATGARPRRLPFGEDDIIYFRTLRDYHRLRDLARGKRRFAVIGAGFIGCEIAAALASNGNEVTMIFPGLNVADRLLPHSLAEYVSAQYSRRGVRLLPREKAAGLEKRSSNYSLLTTSGRELLVDGVVAGIGVQPNVELARAAGLEVNNGIVVDGFLRASRPHVFAAGDSAAFHNPALGERIRVEHEDNANTMGRLAGRNMAGARERYDHLPSFYSDLFDDGYEAVGHVDSSLQTYADWTDPNKQGVIYYLREGRVRGVLLWNLWGQVDRARALISERGPFGPEDLSGRLGAREYSPASDAGAMMEKPGRMTLLDSSARHSIV